MTEDYGARPNTVPWPPLIYSAALLVAWVLQRVDPFELGDRMLARVPWGLGLALFVLGIALDLWAFATLRRKDTPVMPNQPAKVLVVTGPYRFTRNPIYLGNTLALLGFGLMLRWSWAVLLVPVAMSAVNWLAISREEQHLARRFGGEWRVYSERVRRWL
jgi:protein-S-isoprenylcysteine O-methyltransferase Ste14